MLVLSRKEQEHIRIGEDVRISVISIRGGKVRLGIDAPDDVVILREEVQRLNLLEPPQTLELTVVG